MSESTQTEPVDNQEQAAPQQAQPDINAKLIEELNKYKTKANELETLFKKTKEEELTKNQQWQQLAELKEKEANEAIDKAEKLKTAFVQKEKMAAIREAAIQAGIRKESIPDLRLIDFPEIKLETNSEGEFNTSGADKAVQRLKTLRPHWFQSSTPNVNTASPSVTNSSSGVTWDDLKKAEAEAKKTGKYEQYKELVLKYKANN